MFLTPSWIDQLSRTPTAAAGDQTADDAPREVSSEIGDGNGEVPADAIEVPEPHSNLPKGCQWASSYSTHRIDDPASYSEATPKYIGGKG
jgi:hypothetical protein